MPKWIDLNDASGARLKIAHIDVAGQSTMHLFVTGLSYLNPAWQRAIEELGFSAGGSRKYLVRRVRTDERLTPSEFRPVFPHAAVRDLAPESYMLNLQTARADKAKPATAEERAASIDVNNAVLLGRNSDADRVFESAGSRYLIRINSHGQEVRIDESDSTPMHVVLRLPKRSAGFLPPEVVARQQAEDLLRCTDGFVRSMVLGEVQHSEDSDRFLRAVFGTGPYSTAQYDQMHAAVETSLVRYLRDGFEVAQDAYGEAARLTDLLPPFKGRLRGAGTMAAPISVIAQRLLGDTNGKSVVVPNAFDGASFAFLPEGTTVRAYRGAKDLSDLSAGINLRASAEWQDGEFAAAREVGADAILYNADPSYGPDGRREDFVTSLAAMKALKDGGRAVIVLAADGTPGEPAAASRAFLQMMADRYEVQGLFETAPILSRKLGVPEGSPGLRVLSLVNRKPLATAPVAGVLPLISSWDELKSHVDDVMARGKVMDAEAQGVDVERAVSEGRVQRPYIAFSRAGEARCMVPSNMQAPLQAMMTRIERLYGGVDELVMRELGWSWASLNERLSPEQVDGLAAIMVRHLEGRGHILADETGIGKGRQLAALVAWAIKRGQPVFFCTDKANLFSDLARDLKDIGEWDRVRPMILNSDGDITWDPAPGEPSVVLAAPTPAARVKQMIEESIPLEEAAFNTAFLTYSQIGGVDSEKAQWVKNQLANAMLIFDEAHVAAGSDSQIASHVAEMGSLAKNVQFASATWAKSENNLHIYAPAFPESVNVASLAAAIRKGGESFSEVLSSMLCIEGGLIRREHDLSKLDVSVYIDEARRAENERVSDAVAAALGAATYLAGDLTQIFMRGNRETLRVLREAKAAREAIIARENGQARGAAPSRSSGSIMSSSFGTGSVLYQTMKAVQGALNAGQVADRAISLFQAGLKPVIVSEATNEALTRMLMEREAGPLLAGAKRALPSHTRMPTIRDAVREVLMPRLTMVSHREITEDDIQDEEPLPGATARPIGTRLAAADEAEAEAREEGGDLEEDDVPLTAAMRVGQRDQALLRRLNGEGSDEETVNLDEAIASAAVPTSAAPRRRMVRMLDLPGLSDDERKQYEDGVAQLEQLIAAIPEIPVSAFDVIAQRLRDAGIRVGEITGRSFQLERAAPPAPAEGEPAAQGAEGAESALWRVQPRMRTKRSVNAVKRAFNNGDIDILCINRSAATGASMHASPRFLDQKRRVLIEHQIPEDPTNRIQLIGRVNRYDQVSVPLVETSCTGIYGEVRVVMMRNRQLQKMSANVRSSRDNPMLAKDVPDLFNSLGLEAVRSYVQDEPLVARKLALPDNFLETPGMGVVNTFLMRIPLLLSKEQKAVYEQIFMRFDESFNRHELLGTNPLKTNEYDWRAKEISSSVFFGDSSGERSNAVEQLFEAPPLVPGDAPATSAVVPDGGASATTVVEAIPQAGAAPEGGVSVIQLAANDGGDTGTQDGDADAADELLSEFDRPVFIKKIAFEEDLKPLSWGACVGAIGASRDMLVDGGHFQRDQASVVGWKPEVLDRVHVGMNAIAKLAQTAGGFLDYNEAVTKSKAGERAHLRAHWLKEHAHLLVPGGSFISREQPGVDSWGDKIGVIVDVKLPAEVRDLLSSHKWKLSVAFPGSERPVVYSLQSILSGVRGSVKIGQVTGELLTDAWTPLYPGPSALLQDTRNELTKRQFDNSPTGKRRREAYVLGGNMYLAYDWAVKSRTGQSVIYTDDKGMRQRGVLLPHSITRIGARFMPMRVWAGQVKPFIQGLMAQSPEAELKLKTTFVGDVWGMSIKPNEGILYLVKSSDARRMSRLMKGAQAKIRQEEVGSGATASQDPLNIAIRVMTRNAPRVTAASTGGRRRTTIVDEIFVAGSIEAVIEKASIPVGFVGVKMKFDPSNDALLGRAVAILAKAVGLELYAEGSERAVAKEVGRSYFAELRAQSLARRAQVRESINASAEAARWTEAGAAGAGSDARDGTEPRTDEAPIADRLAA